jgi:hypothetical protein
MSFAIMRNTHEVFRKSIELMSESLDKGALDDFRQEWRGQIDGEGIIVG